MPNFADEENGSGGPSCMVTRRELIVSMAGLAIVVLTLVLGRVTSSSVVLITPMNETVPFPDVEASFGHKVPTSGILGLFYAATPLNACISLQAYDSNQTVLPAFLLIERGDCDFVTKVQLAQDAGYSAAIVYNNEMSYDLVTMSGSSYGIEIPAVFISKEAGDILLQYVGNTNARLYILPALENTAWSVMAGSFVSLLAVSVVFSAFFFVRRQRIRRNNSQLSSHDSPSLTKGDLKAFPVSVFSKTDSANLESCAICLEDYINGDKLRVLPCNHEFHMTCIDQWLTTRRPFCPICKRDARQKDAKPAPSESTPLLVTVRNAETSSSLPSMSQSTNDSAGDIC